MVAFCSDPTVMGGAMGALQGYADDPEHSLESTAKGAAIGALTSAAGAKLVPGGSSRAVNLCTSPRHDRLAGGGKKVVVHEAAGQAGGRCRSYHDPALVPPHGYIAFYLWLRHGFKAHAIIHNGKHGNLEWLPGKAVALSADCAPRAVLGALLAYLVVSMPVSDKRLSVVPIHREELVIMVPPGRRSRR